MEKAPQYLPSALAAERVHRMNRDMKLIVLVRDPIDRAVSHFLQVHVGACLIAQHLSLQLADIFDKTLPAISPMHTMVPYQFPFF